MKWILLMLGLMLLIGTASATGNATGLIYDYFSSVGLSGASVNLTNHAETYSASTTTNATGWYLITDLPADNYNIKARAVESRYVPRSHYLSVSNDATRTKSMRMYADTSFSQTIHFSVSEEVKKNTSIRLWWTTDLPTKGYIEYGTTTSYGSETPNDDYSYVHFVEITGLSSQTSYHYRIVSTDLHSTNYNSADYTFTTLSTTALDNLVKAARNDGALPKTYYVRTDGNNSNTGLTNDAGNAWLTIDYAVDTVDVGDTILVQSGTYNESVSISAFQADYGGGISTHHIRLIADGDVILDGGNGRSDAIKIDSRMSNQGYVDITGFKVCNYTRYAFYALGALNINIINSVVEDCGNQGIYFRDLADIQYSHVLNNTFTSCGGIESLASTYMRFKNNTFDDFSGYAVTASGKSIIVEDIIANGSTQGINMESISFATIRDCTVTNITDRSIRIGCGETYAILVHNNTITSPIGANYLVTQYPNTMATYTENTFRVGSVSVKGDFVYVYNNSLSALHPTGGSESATAETNCEKSIVENNNIIGGILIDRQLDCTIKNNIMNAVRTNSFLEPSENVKIVNNVMRNSTNAVLINTACDDISITNNIFYNKSGYCIDNQAGTNLTVSYNCVWLNGTTVYNGVTASNTLYQDPLFADAMGEDFHLNSTYGTWNGTNWNIMVTDSPCIDAGDPTSDYSNEPILNGNRINMGTYGNTNEASKSATWSAGSNIFVGYAVEINTNGDVTQKGSPPSTATNLTGIFTVVIS